MLGSIYDESLSREQVFTAIQKAGEQIGFQFVSYGIRVPLTVGRPQVLILENYPKAWIDRYVDRKYVDIDPSVIHGARSQAPLLWKQTLDQAPEFWEDAAGHDLKHGWAQSTLDGTGAAGLLTLARGGAQEITRKELEQNLARMRWLSSLAHLALQRRLRSELPKAHGINLTAREVEVLKWSAAGKTCDVTASILNITSETVRFHLRNSCRKLECFNKTQAVAHAAMLGLLS